MLDRNALTHVHVVEPELVAAVVTDGHGGGTEVDHLDLVRVAGVRAVRVVAPMYGDQGGSHDRVWAVWTHARLIGRGAEIYKPLKQNRP